MIARLKGIVDEKQKDRVILDVQGVGYSLLVPETVVLRMPNLGEPVTLQVYTHVREDQLSLFGFLTTLEKDVFEILLSASGVGPKLALAVLSAVDARAVLEAVSQGNKTMLSGISGVGKKTVEKIFVEIREKAEKRLLLERGEEPGDGKKRASKSMVAALHSDIVWLQDLEQALIGLGYRDADVKTVLRDVAERAGDIRNFDDAIKYSLQLLSGGKTSMRGTA